MRGFRPPTRALVVAFSLLVVAASVLAVTASASGSPDQRWRPFHLTKECPPSTMQGQIGDYCTVTSSNVRAIPAGTLIFYAQAAGQDNLDSDVILYAGRGKTATGHCELVFATGLGECRLFGGTRTLEGIRARVDVSFLDDYDWAWDGTYRFEDD